MSKRDLWYLVAALVAGVVGFSGVASGLAGSFKILSLVFLCVAVLPVIFGRRIPDAWRRPEEEPRGVWVGVQSLKKLVKKEPR
jgi:uncharacterized membrane protein YtjA (UPF0391 family)